MKNVASVKKLRIHSVYHTIREKKNKKDAKSAFSVVLAARPGRVICIAVVV